MSIPSTTVNFHGVQRIHARSPGSVGAPIILRLITNNGTTELTLFTNDQTYSDLMVDAINAVWDSLANPPPRAACPHEHAAYEALHYIFREAR